MMDLNDAIDELREVADSPQITALSTAARQVLAELDVLRARLAEQETEEVTTEWGVRWPLDDEPEEVEIHGDDRQGAVFAARVNAGEVITSTVRTWRSPWTPERSS